eukprot:scaffold118724_cov63-Phaeocystis_antarctica.AAC.5
MACRRSRGVRLTTARARAESVSEPRKTPITRIVRGKCELESARRASWWKMSSACVARSMVMTR